jgi:hypothetical protein
VSAEKQELSQSLRVLVVVLAALIAFFFPSSVGGVISRTLTGASLVLTCGLLVALLCLPGGVVPAGLLLATGLGLLGLLSTFTLLSPFTGYSPGVVLIYLAIGLLYLVNLRSIGASSIVEYAALALSVGSLLIGIAIVGQVKIVAQILMSYYAAFYPELVPNMIDLLHKPVITFATHSVAGFMIYLLFYMALKAYDVRGRMFFLGLACGHLALLILLRSTTAAIFASIAVVQLGWLVWRRFPRIAGPALLTAFAAPIALGVYFGVRPADVVEAVQAAVLGDKISGLLVRFRPDGLLAQNLIYLSRHPLSPIGVSFSESLNLGDSGVVVHLLRGSLPFLVAVYGGLFLFLRYNVASRTSAIWLWCVIGLFEIGFPPLMYFRFVCFVPLLVVYLNSLEYPARAVHSDNLSIE